VNATSKIIVVINVGPEVSKLCELLEKAAEKLKGISISPFLADSVGCVTERLEKIFPDTSRFAMMPERFPALVVPDEFSKSQNEALKKFAEEMAEVKKLEEIPTTSKAKRSRCSVCRGSGWDRRGRPCRECSR
jgi:hypothetical protein